MKKEPLSIDYTDTNFDLNDVNLSLDHIFLSVKTENISNINIDRIESKILFYEQNNRTGFVIEFLFPTHN